ncbi:hypothetical protein MKZ38_010219 [Zalerion maritima]|uniref:C2H2-type domain-containing protein n=1 Tax=Zalerion maritima TaxID=339359 RepID=A0AAD5RFI8_9PEZI|nr:hypothetical protein MKZ38_010219 [Zalerion maritima]
MPPRFQTLPPAQTSSAREAMQSFYCQLCSKGYSRMNDYEAHLSSYDHAHRQRLKDMKDMLKGDSSRTRKAEARADGLISIKIGSDPASSSTSGSGFKKGGFKKAGFAPIGGGAPKPDIANEDETASDLTKTAGGGTKKSTNDQESDTEDEGYELYDPRNPSG